MTQEEINDKFIKENHCEKYLERDASRFDGTEYQVQTVTSFSADDNKILRRLQKISFVLLYMIVGKKRNLTERR